MRVVTIASNFPDRYYPAITPWSKIQVDSVCQFTECKIEVISPRPYTIPNKFFPFYHFAKLPQCERSTQGYLIHYPKYFYFLPKKIFFPLSGISFSQCITAYCSHSIMRPDVIHARFSYMDGYGALKICKKWNVPLIFDVHGKVEFEEYLKQPFIRKFQQNTIQYAKKILCVAKWQIKKGISLGIPECKLEYVPLGVDTERFDQIITSDACMNIKNQDNSKLIFLFVGHLNKMKGVAYLLQAISRLDQKILKKCHFIIVGDGPEKNNLQHDADSLGLNSFITFSGTVVGDDLIRLYASADVFVLPSLSEGRPTVINEAMISECAIIASNIDGIPEQVTDGYNGFLVNPASPRQLAEKISLFVENENLADIMGKNSKRKIFDDGITWENYARNVEKVYMDVINE